MYESKNLSVLSYANGFTLWHYTAEDNANTVQAEGYFNGAADMLRAGDIIVANVDTAHPKKAGALMRRVEAAAPGAVKISALSA